MRPVESAMRIAPYSSPKLMLTFFTRGSEASARASRAERMGMVCSGRTSSQRSFTG